MFINQASKLSGATQRAIRLYEELGLMKVSRTGKYRIYNQNNISQIKMIKEAQVLGITLADMVTLRGSQEDFDWKLVSSYLIEKQWQVEEKIKELELQKQRIKEYKISIDICIQELDSNL